MDERTESAGSSSASPASASSPDPLHTHDTIIDVAEDYDRTPPADTLETLASLSNPFLSTRIYHELDEFKEHEMEVHPESRGNTQFHLARARGRMVGRTAGMAQLCGQESNGIGGCGGSGGGSGGDAEAGVERGRDEHQRRVKQEQNDWYSFGSYD